MKKIIGIILTLSIIAGFMPAISAAGGAGMSFETVLIENSDELKALADTVNSGTDSGAGKYYKLTADIDLGGEAWTPIGHFKYDDNDGAVVLESNPFMGVFDGDGHIISNYKISNADGKTTKGLFGAIGNGSTVKNLGVKDVIISNDLSWNWTAAGAITGIALEGSKISGCFVKNFWMGFAEGATSADRGYNAVGGIAGFLYGTMDSCYSVGMTLGSDMYWQIKGGLAGKMLRTSDIRNCYTDSYTSVGYIGDNVNVTNTYYGTEAPWPYAYGADGMKYYGTQTTLDELKLKAEELGNAFEADSNAINDGYPILSWEKFNEIPGMEGNGCFDNPYLIKDINGLKKISDMSNTSDMYFKLMTDIDLGGTEWTTHIGATESTAFKGDFDGNGHIIKNYKFEVSGNDYNTYALFSYVSGNAYIHDLGVENISFHIDTWWDSYNSICGGIVAKISENADIERCFAKNIVFTTSFVRGTDGYNQGEFGCGGGLIGEVYGEGVEIRSCYSQGFKEELKEGSWDIVNYDGGILGKGTNVGIIENCYSDTTIGRTADWVEVNNCYQSGSSKEWPEGFYWAYIEMPENGLGYEWCVDFVPSQNGPKLKWEENTGYYDRLIPVGTMNMTSETAKSRFGLSDGEILYGRKYRNSSVLRLPEGQTITYPVSLTENEYYRVSFKAAAQNTDSNISFCLGDDEIQFKDTVIRNKWENKAAYVKASSTGLADLKISGTSEMLIDDIDVVCVNPDIEVEAIKNSIELKYQRLDVVDCDLKFSSTIYDGIELTYNGSYINEYGRLTEEIPVGFGTVTDNLTATVQVGDRIAAASMDLKVAMREPYDILSIGLVDENGNSVYGLEKAYEVNAVNIDINEMTQGAKLYAALYKNEVLAKVKIAPITSNKVKLNLEVGDADKLKLFVLSNDTVTPLAMHEESLDVLEDDARVTIRTIGDSICQTYDKAYQDSYYGITGWGQVIREEFLSNVTIDNSLARSGMSAFEFLTSREDRIGQLANKLQKGDYVLIQLGTNDPNYGTKEDFKCYINQFVSMARQKGAIPVLITPPDTYDAATDEKAADGIHYVVESKLMGFPDVFREIAKERDIPLIDFNKECLDLMANIGFSGITELGYFIGQNGDTFHFTEEGAKWIAAGIAEGLEELGMPIAKFRGVYSPVAGMAKLPAESFTIASSASDTPIAADEAVDGNYLTVASMGDYNGKAIYDINGNIGSDYISLMTVETTSSVEVDSIKLNYEFATAMYDGTFYTFGPAMYLNKPVIPWPEGLEIYASDTGENNSWKKVYDSPSLKGCIRTEIRPEILWNSTGGKQTYYLFPLDIPTSARYFRIAIRDIKPWLGGINIPEVELYGNMASVESANYKPISMDIPDSTSVAISGNGELGDGFGLAGNLIYLNVKTKKGYEIESVSVNNDSLAQTDGVYCFSMPDTAANIVVKSRVCEEGLPKMNLTSAYLAQGYKAVQTGEVPVISFQFDSDVGNINRDMILVNNEAESGLVQHAFVDAVNSKLVHVVMYSDKLDAGKIYKISFSNKVFSKEGAAINGEPSYTFATAADYRGISGDEYEKTDGQEWTSKNPYVTFDTYNQAGNVWKQIPGVSQELRDMGVSGGEGGQWMQAIEVDSVDGSLLFAGVDIGGMVRSTDGGQSWHRSTSGFLAAGCVDIKIDPNNKNRVLAIGSLSDSSVCGIYLSEDMGHSWKQVYSYIFNGQRDTRKQLAWDKSSKDDVTGGSKVAYWSNLYKLVASNEGYDQEWIQPKTDKVGGLFKTTDGGKSWFLVNADMSDSVVEVNPNDGTVYVGNERGFFRSTDGGVTFEHIYSDEPIYGLDVIDTYPNNVYINNSQGVLVSTDSGRTFEFIGNGASGGSGFPYRTNLTDVRNITRDLAVSPANPNHMLVDSRDYINYNNRRYYSKDGGKTWNECEYDNSKDFFFNHNRQHPFAWHPTDENKVWSLGGDWITSSSNGGKTFVWDANGYCGTPPGGRFNFNPYNTNLLFIGAQDLLGMISKDMGYTWTPIRAADGSGFGCSYGSVAVDETTFISSMSKAWSDGGFIGISTDGGNTFTLHEELPIKTGFARRARSYWVSPRNNHTVIAGEYISYDKGQSWEEITDWGCNNVVAVNYYHNKELWGVVKKWKDSAYRWAEYIVCSYDNGRTWYPFAEALADDQRILYDQATGYKLGSGIHIWDVEYDGINDILYYVAGNDNTGAVIIKVDKNESMNIGKNANGLDATGAKFFHTIALDPRYPEILYTGAYDTIRHEAAVQRSCDGGKSFQTLTAAGAKSSIVKDGPSAGTSVESLVVHPITGELWVWSTAEGIWTFPAPYEN
ncbi:MAG: GDSL-type esterase/lipase family protein [Clostridiales bacterium]|nr:GDSL-type esterase/lipase family protein [Clostridiales bacterium]